MMDERTTQVRNKIMSEMAMLMYLFVAAAFAVLLPASGVECDSALIIQQSVYLIPWHQDGP